MNCLQFLPIRSCILVATALFLANCLPLAAQELAPVPSDAAQREAVKLIEEVYGEEHAQAKTSAEKTALANKLLEQAAESEDLTNRYVLFRVVSDLATQAGDVETALRAVGEMAKDFQVDLFELKGSVLSAARKSASLTKHRKALAEHALALIDEAVERDDFVAAKYLGQLALDSARKAKERDLTKRIVTRNKLVTEVAEEYSAAKDAFQTLEESPTDPEANLVAGSYLCFMKGNWGKGIPMLALGRDGQSTKLAIKELGEVTDVEGQVALGDGWWALSETKDGLAEERARERAVVWYRLASPKLAGLVKSKVEKRISEIPKERLERLPAPKLLPTPSSPPPMAVAPFDAQRAKEHQRAWAASSADPPRGKWFDMLKLVDMERDPVQGRWMRDGDEINVAPQRWARMMLPVKVDGNYDLKVEFTRTAGDDAVVVFLPVGDRLCQLHLSGWHGRASGLEQIDGRSAFDNPTSVRPGTLTTGRRYAVLAKVRPEGENVSIDVSLNDKPYIHWTGAQASLDVYHEWRLPEPRRPGLGVGARNTSATFHGAHLRRLSDKTASAE